MEEGGAGIEEEGGGSEKVVGRRDGRRSSMMTYKGVEFLWNMKQYIECVAKEVKGYGKIE